jgi:phage terminase Nu1 subunit (DNA packaging protein)
VRKAAYQLEQCGVNYHAFFDFAEADRLRAEWLAESDVDAGDDDEVGPYAEAKAKDRHFKALLSELEYRKRIGELVERSAVEAEAFRIGRQVRDTQKNIPARLCDILAAETDKRKIYEILEAEITKSHKALAQDDGDEPKLSGEAQHVVDGMDGQDTESCVAEVGR